MIKTEGTREGYEYKLEKRVEFFPTARYVTTDAEENAKGQQRKDAEGAALPHSPLVTIELSGGYLHSLGLWASPNDVLVAASHRTPTAVTVMMVNAATSMEILRRKLVMTGGNAMVRIYAWYRI